MNEASLLEKCQQYILVEYSTEASTGQRVANCIRVKREHFSIEFCRFYDNDFFSSTEALLIQWGSSVSNEDIEFRNYLLAEHLTFGEKQKLNNIFEELSLDFSICTTFPTEVLENDTDFNIILRNEEVIKVAREPRAKFLINFLLSKENLLATNAFYKKFKFAIFNPSAFMKLDTSAIRSLNLYEKQEPTINQSSSTTVYGFLSQFVTTQMGLRVLKEWLFQPLRSAADINFRLNSVRMYIDNADLRQSFKQFLKKLPNLDKLIIKFWRFKNGQRTNLNLDDCYKLYNVLRSLDSLICDLREVSINENDRLFLDMLNNILGDFNNLALMIEKYIDLERASKTGECFINPSCSKALTHIDDKINSLSSAIDQLAKELISEFGTEISTIESAKTGTIFEARKEKAAEFFRESKGKYTVITTRKTTLTFTFKELQELNNEIEVLKISYLEKQKEFTMNILEVTSSYLPALESANYIMLEHDILSSFAEMYLNPRDNNVFCIPVILDENINQRNCIDLKNSWHICIKNCVPNNLYLSDSTQKMAIITGPNMGGKSTFIRQSALSVLLAHIGCPVPAMSCKITLLSGIYTRVGASDSQLKGISTFMNEMMETSNLLASADSKSFMIIDELGRGTSTYEGLGLAQAIVEHIVKEKGCFCLFATHYFELTKLANFFPTIKNLSMKTMEQRDQLVFTYQIMQGQVDKSFGIHLIEHMNFPMEIITEAKQILARLENFKR